MKLPSLLLLLLLFFTKSTLFSQVLKNVTIHLDGAGQVADVKYIASIDKYILVGKFTSVDSSPANNIALLDADFNFVSANFPPINNEIKAVEVFGNNVYIGGSFTTVDGHPQLGLARFIITAPPISGNPYVVTDQPSFQPINSTGVFESVNDMDMNGAEIIATGLFYDNPRKGILAFNASSGTVSNKFAPDSDCFWAEASGVGFCGLTMKVKRVGLNYVLIGNRFENPYYETLYTSMMTFNPSGVTISGNTKPSYYNLVPGQANRNTSLCKINDSIIFTSIGKNAGYALGAFNTLNTAYYKVGLIDVPASDHAFEMYNGNFFYLNTTTNSIQRSTISTTGSGSTTVFHLTNTTAIPVNSNPEGTCEVDLFHVVKNLFFVSSDNLSTVGGQSRTGLAVICLEPENPKKMNNLWNAPQPQPPTPVPFELDTIVCAGNIKAYTVPPAMYAKGYKWTFNGPGVKYIISQNAAFVPTESQFSDGTGQELNGSIYSDQQFAYKIWLMFDESFTGGQLKVEPYSLCNTLTDYLLAKPVTANLVLAPLPAITIADSLVLSCLNDTLDLVVTSSTPAVNLSWIDQNGTIVPNDSIQLTKTGSLSISFPRYFQAIVKQNTGNMCRVRDSVFVNRNVVEPQLIISGALPIWNCYTDSLQIVVIDTNSMAPESAVINSWNQLTSDYSNPNPLTIYSALDPLWFLAAYPSNGCVSTTNFPLSSDIASPVPQIAGFPNGFQQVGTISCLSDSLLVVLSDFNSVNTDNYWIYEGDTIQDSIWVSASDLSYSIADTLGGNLVTVTIDEYRMNPLNGCSTFGPLAAVVFDIRKPNLVSYTGVNTLTCSAANITLDHIPTFGVPTQGWLLPNGTSNGADTLVVTSTGEFYYEVVGNNGCVNIDTVTVQQTNELLFASSMDTLVCPGLSFNVNAVAIGPGTMVYSWSNGSQTINPTGIGGLDSLFIVQATNGSGCLGIDTLMARITSPIVATFEAFSSCGSGGFIQVDSIYGGGASALSDYLFAFNGGAYSSNYNFPVTQIAAYPLLIKDTLGCEYSFTTNITGEIQNPDVNFLVSTYNQVGDTIALVNISDFSDFDGVFWTFPTDVELIHATDSVAIFTAIDTGWYNIQFTGYLIDNSVNPADTCFYSFNKPVYFGNFALNFGDSVVDNSISNVQLYPNPIQAGQSQSVTLSFNLASLQQYEVLFTTSLGEILPYISDEGSAQDDVIKTYNLPALAAGTYLIHILAEYGAAQIKLVVQ